MQAEQIRQNLERIEAYVDEARQAVKTASAPEEVRKAVGSLHEQASSAKHQPLMDHVLYRETVLQLEELADDAMRACRDAGGGLAPEVLEAVRRAHGELSRMKEAVLARA